MDNRDGFDIQKLDREVDERLSDVKNLLNENAEPVNESGGEDAADGDAAAPEENTEAEGSDAAPAENAEAEGSDAAPAAEEAQQNDTEGVKNETNAKMEIEALPSESPRMYLNTYETTVKAGSELDKISYIKEITDDADSQETLFTEIQVDGEVDTATPGDYTLTYHVTDSNGNQSNMAVLTVHVQ